jgi:hypothetical protein
MSRAMRSASLGVNRFLSSSVDADDPRMLGVMVDGRCQAEVGVSLDQVADGLLLGYAFTGRGCQSSRSNSGAAGTPIQPPWSRS